MRLVDILARKGSEVVCIEPDRTDGCSGAPDSRKIMFKPYRAACIEGDDHPRRAPHASSPAVEPLPASVRDIMKQPAHRRANRRHRKRHAMGVMLHRTICHLPVLGTDRAWQDGVHGGDLVSAGSTPPISMRMFVRFTSAGALGEDG
jgi:hypothetical protein